MASFHIPVQQLEMFLVVFLRVASILFMVPLFDGKSVPGMFKVGLALAVSMLLFPVVQPYAVRLPGDLPSLCIGIAGEILLGAAIGFSAKLVFAGVELGGQLAGYQMGLAMANIIDPLTSDQISIISQFKALLAMLVFLAMDAHHFFLKALTESFRMIPPLGFFFTESMTHYLTGLVLNMFVIAVKISAPVLAALLISTAALGLVARTVPQMNVFFVAMPVQILLGLLFLGLALPFMVSYLQIIFTELGRGLFTLLGTV